MAITQNTVIILKYSDETSVPPTLNIAEPAYSNVSNKLFINDGDGVVAIGGKFYTDDLETATWQDTANTLVRRNEFGEISATKYTQNNTDLFTHSNAAFNLANTISSSSASAFDQANSAYNQANIANNNAISSGSYANSAFSKANTAAGANGAIQFNLLGGYGAHNQFYYDSGLKTVYANTFNATSNVDAQNIIAYNRFYAGIATQHATPIPYLLAQFTGNNSPYVQVNLQNIDENGSADMVVTSDVGSDETFYITTGIQGSQLEQGALYPLDGYVIVQGNTSQLGGNLIIGAISGTPGIKTKIVSHGIETDNVVAEFDETSVIFYPEITSPTTTRLTLSLASAYDSLNTTSIYANSVYSHANAAYDTANNSYIHANSSYESQNTIGQYANLAYLHANSSYVSQNTTGVYANAAYIHANSAYLSQNTTGVYANAAYSFANSAYQSQNTTGVYANAAYSFANTSNIYFYGVNATQNTTINTVSSHTNASYISQNTTGVYANSAYIHANSSYVSQNITGVYANSAYQQANAAFNLANTRFASSGGTITGDVILNANLTVSGMTTYVNTNTVLIGDNILTLNADIPQDQVPSENAGIEVDRGSSSNTSLLWNEGIGKWTFTNDGTNYRNIGSDASESYANSAYLHANAAFSSANNVAPQVQPAFDKANAAYQSQNTTGVYANTSYLHVNSAYIFANTSNAYFYGVNDTQNTNISIVGFYANSAYSSQNTTGTYANSAFNAANVADQRAATSSVYANVAYIHANSSYVSQNTTGSYANSAYLQANAAYQSQNTTGSYANSAYQQANAAFIKANTAAGIDGQLQLNNSGGFGASANLKFSNTTNTLTTNNVTVIANVGYANTAGTLKVYQFYNEATNSLDTVFI